MLAAKQVEQPFAVFISSSQSEFRDFRKTLKIDIDEQRWSSLRPMRAILIENQRGAMIPTEIRKGIDQSSIYVGIFGKKWSDWTVAEFRYARIRGLPLLVYKFTRGTHGQAGRKSRVDDFLNKEVKQVGIRLREPYRSLDRLGVEILGDLVIQSVEMVRESSDVRKLINTGLSL